MRIIICSFLLFVSHSRRCLSTDTCAVHYGLRILRSIYSRKPQNVVISPVTIKRMMGVIYKGLDQNQKFESLFRFADDDNYFTTQPDYANNFSFASRDLFELFEVLALRYNSQHRMLYSYEAALSGFRCSISSADFGGSSLLNDINEYISQASIGRDLEFLGVNDTIPEDSDFALMGLIHTKPSWNVSYPTSQTSTKFRVNSETSVDVDMLWLQGTFRHGTVRDMDIVRLDYRTVGSHVLYLYLITNSAQEDPFDVASLMRRYRHSCDLRSLLKNEPIEVGIPAFEIDSITNVSDILASLELNKGYLTNMFEIPPSDWNGLFMLHKVHFSVDPRGSPFSSSSRMTPGHKMKFDQPFIYLLVGDDYEILLTGVYSDPRLNPIVVIEGASNIENVNRQINELVADIVSDSHRVEVLLGEIKDSVNTIHNFE